MSSSLPGTEQHDDTPSHARDDARARATLLPAFCCMHSSAACTALLHAQLCCMHGVAACMTLLQSTPRTSLLKQTGGATLKRERNETNGGPCDTPQGIGGMLLSTCTCLEGVRLLCACAEPESIPASDPAAMLPVCTRASCTPHHSSPSACVQRRRVRVAKRGTWCTSDRACTLSRQHR